MATTGELLRDGVARLRASGSESARLDAELILAAAIGVDRTAVIAHPDAPVGADAAATYDAGLARRERGEPVAYIRGFKEFHGLAFATDSRALIPRPETEALVELAEDEVAYRLVERPRPAGSPPVRVLDVGTGAGTIAITLASRLRRRGMAGSVDILAADVSPDALALARENTVGHGAAEIVRFAEADLVPPGEAAFDVIAANLPYVPADTIDRLPIAASFEPRSALDGGPDGLAVIRRLLERLPDALVRDGTALLEIGSDQPVVLWAAIDALLPGWRVAIEPDLSGAPRVARIERPAGGVDR